MPCSPCRRSIALPRASMRGWLANTLAWFPSVVFAWATNRRWVFQARRGLSVVALGGELLSFTVSRLATGALDVLLVYLAIDLARLPELPAKVAIGVVVVVLNYGVSRWLVFGEGRQA
ncbi:MAG: GtrA family protein [Candidatus Spyradenecus sp.]